MKLLLLFILVFTNINAKDTYIISKIDVKKNVEMILKREQVVKLATDLIGIPYKKGGNSPYTGFDCSGLVQYVYSKMNIKIPRTTIAQYNTVINTSNILYKGNLIFFTTKLNSIPDHVGIYIGYNKFIHAPSSGKYVRIDSLNNKYWKLRYLMTGAYIL